MDRERVIALAEGEIMRKLSRAKLCKAEEAAQMLEVADALTIVLDAYHQRPAERAWRGSMIRFTIPYPPGKKGKSEFCRRFGLNAYYGGKHWAQRRRDAEELHMLAKSAMRRAHIRQTTLERPVAVRFFWDDGLDADNHAVIGKAVVDAMKGYIIPNDNRKWLRRVSHEFWSGGKILVEVEELKD